MHRTHLYIKEEIRTLFFHFITMRFLGKNTSEISVECGIEGAGSGMSFHYLGYKEKNQRKESWETSIMFRKIYFYLPWGKAYEIWEDKNNILYSSKSFKFFFSKFYTEKEKKKHPRISTPQLSLRSSSSSPIGNQGQANRLPNFLSG